MKNLRCFALSLLLALPSAALSQTSAAQPDYAGIGRETVAAMARGQWSSVETRFDQRMKAGLPEDKLAAVWRQNTAQAGAFEHIIGISVTEKEAYHIAVVTCAFAHANLDVKVVVDTAGHIAGLFFAPTADYAAIGRQTISALSAGQIASVEARFDDTMRAGLPASKLSAVWQQITSRAGQFDHILGVQLTQQDGYQVALVTCAFANARLDAKVVFDDAGHISGLFFLPSAGEGASTGGR
jgi:hypothetical protein